MKKITAELMPVKAILSSPDDVSKFSSWMWRQREINMFDPQVMAGPRTIVVRASNDEPLLYIPVQPVLMYDAIASHPDLTPRQEALCLWRIGQVVDETAKLTGFQEIYFMCRDDRVSDICAAHGFTEVKNVRVLKKTISVPTEV